MCQGAHCSFIPWYFVCCLGKCGQVYKLEIIRRVCVDALEETLALKISTSPTSFSAGGADGRIGSLLMWLQVLIIGPFHGPKSFPFLPNPRWITGCLRPHYLVGKAGSEDTFSGDLFIC